MAGVPTDRRTGSVGSETSKTKWSSVCGFPRSRHLESLWVRPVGVRRRPRRHRHEPDEPPRKLPGPSLSLRPRDQSRPSLDVVGCDATALSTLRMARVSVRAWSTRRHGVGDGTGPLFDLLARRRRRVGRSEGPEPPDARSPEFVTTERAQHHRVLDGPGRLLRLLQGQNAPRPALRAATRVAMRLLVERHLFLLIGPSVATVPLGRLAERHRVRSLGSSG
jgi:hypothetical protein